MPPLLARFSRMLQRLLLLLAAVAVAGVLTSPAAPATRATPPAPETVTAPLAPVPLPPASPQQDPPELRALWVDAFHDGFKTPAQVDELVAWTRQANFNALFVQVRRRGDAYYAGGLEPRTEDPDVAPGFDALQYLIQRAHQGPQPLQVHAWLATLAIWHRQHVRPADPAHVFNRYGLDVPPEGTWLMLRDDGEAWAGSNTSGTYYLDPGHPAAARHTADVYLDVLRRYDVDGIHLDHARYFEGARGRWGYNPTSVARFNQRFGREPGSLTDPHDPDWAAWRRDQVTALVRRVYLEAKALKPQAAVSVAVIAWGTGPQGPDGWERSAPFGTVFQDWRYWLHEGIVDYVLPMNYFREAGPQAASFDRWVEWQQANRGRRAVVPGVGAYLNQIGESLAQLARARALGPLGVALYSYAVPVEGADSPALPDRAGLAARFRELFPRPAPVPDLPWLTHPAAGSVLVETPGVESAQVSLVGAATSVDWRTDGTGLAGAVELPPGVYWLTVSAPGVDPTPIDVAIHPGRVSVIRYAHGVSPSPRGDGGGEGDASL